MAHLNREFGNDKRRFIVGNLVEDELPSADLCIVKDVLQHLSNASVHQFLRDQLPRFKSALVTNDTRRIPLTHLLRPWKIKKANSDIASGETRPLQLTRPPFSLRTERLGWYRLLIGQTIVEKEILLWERSKS